MTHFVQRMLSNLEDWPDRIFATEVRGDRLVTTEGKRLRAFVEIARRALREFGIRPGDRVVLLAANSTRWIATDLAILAEGATCVPLYARQAPSELAEAILDADPRLVLVGEATLSDALGCALSERRSNDQRELPALLRLDTLFEGAAPESFDSAKPLAPDHAVTIVYTSGSSGEPKGVVTTVANVEHMLPILDAKLRELTGRPGGTDRVFHYLPFCFAGSRMVLWACLFRANGIMMSSSLDDLPREIRTARPHYFLNVPALLERIRAGVENEIAQRPWPVRVAYAEAIAAWRRRRAGELRKRDALALALAKRTLFRAIRAKVGPLLEGLVCGSAPLSEDVQRWFSELLEIPVYQVYGLTETTAIVTIDRRDAVVPGRVGHVIAGCEVKLGPEGELFVRGPNVFPGYFRRPEATRAAFTDDGWFRTGDQCTLDAHGNLAVIGRVKNLIVPTSGHNVAPEPLEEKLRELVPGIEHAVVLGHGRPFLSVLVTGKVDPATLDAALARLNAELPHYRRIRRAHVARERLTVENGLLTANQKLRRAAIERHFEDEIARLYA